MSKPREIRLEDLPNGHIRIHFGAAGGYATYPNISEAHDATVVWIGRDMRRTAARLDELSRLLLTLKERNP